MNRRKFLATASSMAIAPTVIIGGEETKITGVGLFGDGQHTTIKMFVHAGETLDLNSIPQTVKTVTVFPGGSVEFTSPWIRFNLTALGKPLDFDMDNLRASPEETQGVILIGNHQQGTQHD